MFIFFPNILFLKKDKEAISASCSPFFKRVENMSKYIEAECTKAITNTLKEKSITVSKCMTSVEFPLGRDVVSSVLCFCIFKNKHSKVIFKKQNQI